MKLSNGTIINEPIRFLSMVYPLAHDRAGNPISFSFTFNNHKIRTATQEEGEILRAEIEKQVPEAVIPSQDEVKKQDWEIPTPADTPSSDTV